MSLSPKQEKFCQCIVSGMSGKDSYLTAYNCNSDRVARNEAAVLLKRDDITERIQELNKPVQNHAINTAISEREKKRSILWDFINNPDKDDSTRLKAIDLLNKMDSEYININRNIEETTDLNNLDIDTLKKLSDGL